MTIDYSEIVSIVAEIIRVALPIGIILSLSEWIVKFFMKAVMGKFLREDKRDYE